MHVSGVFAKADYKKYVSLMNYWDTNWAMLSINRICARSTRRLSNALRICAFDFLFDRQYLIQSKPIQDRLEQSAYEILIWNRRMLTSISESCWLWWSCVWLRMCVSIYVMRKIVDTLANAFFYSLWNCFVYSARPATGAWHLHE